MIRLGTPENDLIVQTQENDIAWGLEGADIIAGNAGDDELYGNQGNDIVLGGIGTDSLWGGQDDDLLVGNPGVDYVNGNLGNDTVHGGQGDDSVHGGQGNDRVSGDRGNDVLHGDLGDDTLFGGTGRDIFVLDSGEDIVVDFTPGEDQIGLKAGVTFDTLLLSQRGEDTVVTNLNTGAIIGILQGIDATILNADNFTNSLLNLPTPSPTPEPTPSSTPSSIPVAAPVPTILAPATEIIAIETDPGNTLETATSILFAATTRTFSQSVGGSDIADYYKFSLGATNTFELSLTGLTALATVDVLDEQGNVVLNGQLANNTSVISGELKGGAYRLRITSNAPTNYLLNARTVPQIPGVTLDGMDVPLTIDTDISGPLIGLDTFKNDNRFLTTNGSGLTVDGSGYTVVVLDSGINKDHPAFGNRIVHSFDYADSDSDASDDAPDTNGHGSHVSSIIASSDSQYPGVAPGADIIHFKVFGKAIDPKTGQIVRTSSTAFQRQALHWILQEEDGISNKERYNIVSVNMSLSTTDKDVDGDGKEDSSNFQTPQELYTVRKELTRLREAGVVVVASSGNDFFTHSSTPGVAYPSAHPDVISVGAVYDTDVGIRSYRGGAQDTVTGADIITAFSQRHPTLTTAFAPGAIIYGANPTGDGFTPKSGTSQAAPHVAGMVALAQQLAKQTIGRLLTPAEFEQMLIDTGDTITDGDDEKGNVTSTNVNYKRVNMLALAEAILQLPPTPGTSLANPDILSNVAVTLTGTSGNDSLPPVTNAASVEPITINAADLLANDTQNGNWVIDSVSNEMNGTATLSGNTVTFTPEQPSLQPSTFGYSPASFEYTLRNTDTNQLSNSATVTLETSLNVNGLGGNDTITGTRFSDSLRGDEGNDSIYAGAGANDTVIGGDGDDYALIVGGNNFVDLGAGNDEVFLESTTPLTTIIGGAGDDQVVNGGTGSDTIGGGTLQDTIEGGDGNDNIGGSWDNDSLLGDGGNDTIFGGSGEDTILGGDNSDTIFGDADFDGITFNLLNDSISGGQGDDYIEVDTTLVNFSISFAVDDLVQGNDTVRGGEGNDTIGRLGFSVGATGLDYYDGEEGNDSILGGNQGSNAVGDTLIGGDGNDTIRGGTDDSGRDSILGGNGNDSIAGGAESSGGDTIDGGNGEDSIQGGAGNDRLLGGIGHDFIDGGNDNDTVLGGDQNDTLLGGAGNDSIVGGNDEDTIEGGFGSDTLSGFNGSTGGDGTDRFVYNLNAILPFSPTTVGNISNVPPAVSQSEADYILAFDVNQDQIEIGTTVVPNVDLDNTQNPPNPNPFVFGGSPVNIGNPGLVGASVGVTYLTGTTDSLVYIERNGIAGFTNEDIALITLVGINPGSLITPNFIPSSSQPTVTLTITDGVAAERDPSTNAPNVATFIVARTGAILDALTVNYTINGTAANGTDYQSLTGSVTIPAGQTEAVITVTPTDDVAFEQAETVSLTLDNSGFYIVGTPNAGTATIYDNETVFVSNAYTTAGDTVEGGQAVVGINAFDAINSGIINTGGDNTTPGIVEVRAGNYNEIVDIPRTVSLRGPNAGVAGNGTRNPEANITGTVGRVQFALGATEPNMGSVTIDGFRIDPPDGQIALQITGAGNNTTITNNIIEGVNNENAVFAAPSMIRTQNLTISNNLIRNVTGNTPGPEGVNGIVLGDVTSLTIQNNNIDSITGPGGRGINLAGIAGGTISGNTINNTVLDGIQLDNGLAGSGFPTSGVTISDNTITAANTSNTTNAGGILLDSSTGTTGAAFGTNIQVSGNNISTTLNAALAIDADTTGLGNVTVTNNAFVEGGGAGSSIVSNSGETLTATGNFSDLARMTALVAGNVSGTGTTTI